MSPHDASASPQAHRGYILVVWICAVGSVAASVVLTAVAATGPSSLVLAGGLLGFSEVSATLLAVMFWVFSLLVCVVAAFLMRPGSAAFAPPLGGTISLAAPVAIATLLPSALAQWSRGQTLAADGSSSSAATATIVSMIVGAAIGVIMLVMADRYRRARLVRTNGSAARASHRPGPATAVEVPAVAADGRPTRTVITGGRPDVPDSALVHALKNVVTDIDETECGWVVDGIVAHLRLHTAMHFPTRPVGYQFQLSNGAFATVSDNTIGKRRALDFSGSRIVEGSWQPLTLLVWPKDLPENGGWFSWPMDGKVGARMRRDIANAVRLSYANRSWTRAEAHVLLDPLAAPEPLRADAWAV